MNENSAYKLAAFLAFITILLVIGSFIAANICISSMLDAIDDDDSEDYNDAQDGYNLCVLISSISVSGGFISIAFIVIGIYTSKVPTSILKEERRKMIKISFFIIILGSLLFIISTLLIHSTTTLDEHDEALERLVISNWFEMLGIIFVFGGVGLVGLGKSDLYDQIFGSEQKTENKIFCDHCNREIPFDSILCPYCGKEKSTEESVVEVDQLEYI